MRKSAPSIFGFQSSHAGTAPAVTAGVESCADNEIIIDRSGAPSCIGELVQAAMPRMSKKSAFLDLVHISDRITFMNGRSEAALLGVKGELSLRIDMSAEAEAQTYSSLNIIVERIGDGGFRLSFPALRRSNEAMHDDETADNRKFLALVSHELRTPLNAILGFSDLLRSDVASQMAEEKKREYLDLIHNAGEHLLSLVNTILDVSKLDSGTYTLIEDEFDIGSTVADCVRMVERQAAEKNIHLNVRISDEVQTVTADRRAVKQILLNLLSNAVKFTGERGCVSVDLVKGEAGLELTVLDTGIGMTENELSHVGRPFAQIDNSYTRNCEGTGLGLVMVRGLAELHGGSFCLESQIDIGTRAVVILPRALPASAVIKLGADVGSETDPTREMGNDERKSA